MIKILFALCALGWLLYETVVVSGHWEMAFIIAGVACIGTILGEKKDRTGNGLDKH